MQKKQYLKNLIQLNLAVLMISTSGTLGRYIELPVPLIIFLRAAIGGVFLYLFCKWKKLSFKIDKKDRWTVFFSGVLMGLHWILYFISLKMSYFLFVYPQHLFRSSNVQCFVVKNFLVSCLNYTRYTIYHSHHI